MNCRRQARLRTRRKVKSTRGIPKVCGTVREGHKRPKRERYRRCKRPGFPGASSVRIVQVPNPTQSASRTKHRCSMLDRRRTVRISLLRPDDSQGPGGQERVRRGWLRAHVSSVSNSARWLCLSPAISPSPASIKRVRVDMYSGPACGAATAAANRVTSARAAASRAPTRCGPVQSQAHSARQYGRGRRQSWAVHRVYSRAPARGGPRAVAVVGSTVAVIGSTVAVVGSTVAVVGRTVAVVGSTVAVVGSTVAVVGSTVALVGSTVAVAVVGSTVAVAVVGSTGEGGPWPLLALHRTSAVTKDPPRRRAMALAAGMTRREGGIMRGGGGFALGGGSFHPSDELQLGRSRGLKGGCALWHPPRARPGPRTPRAPAAAPAHPRARQELRRGTSQHPAMSAPPASASTEVPPPSPPTLASAGTIGCAVARELSYAFVVVWRSGGCEDRVCDSEITFRKDDGGG
eukprot:1187808-Prorocentrum_minimum.AAC.2